MNKVNIHKLLKNKFVQKVVSGQLPRIVYKYKKVAKHTIQDLIKNQLRFSNPYGFNDPFDCKINGSILYMKSQLYDCLGLDINFKEDEHFFEPGCHVMTYINENMHDLLSEFIGVTCFSEIKDNILMWSHYAEKHTGICLGFDVLKDINFFGEFNEVINDLSMDYVKYRNKYPDIKLLENPDKDLKTILFVKSKEWSYEEEIRVVKNDQGPIKFDKNALVEINLGCEIDSEDKMKIIEIIQANYPDVVCYQAKTNDFEFKLDFIKI